MADLVHRCSRRVDALLTIEEVAELLRMPVATVRYWRVLGTGPRGFILGRRLRYFHQDVLDWDDPRHSDWARPEDEQHYLERGRAAARLLRHHLPDDVRIEYAGAGSIPTEYY